jgi:tetratricopeptide (TPR) repeat protein
MPALALLAWVGLVGLEGGSLRAAPVKSAAYPIARAAAAVALVYSIAISWLLALALSAFYSGAEKGTALLRSGQIPEAVAAYEAVCRIDPDFRGQAELGIGTALMGKGRTKEAAGYLQSAVLDEPQVAAAFFNLGSAYLQLGRFKEASDALGRAAALDPYDSEAEADLGVALARMGRLEEAAEHLRAALRIDPSLEQVKGNLRALEQVLNQRRG